MNRKTLTVLFVVFLALCGLTFWLRWHAKPVRPKGPFPGDTVLTVDINNVGAFNVTSAAATSRVVRKDGRWMVETRYGYPADFRRIVEQLRGLAEMKVGQVIHADPADLTEFGLGSDQATTIRLEDAAGQLLAEIHMGNPRQAQRGGGMAGMPEGMYLCVNTGPVLIVDVPISTMFGWTDSWLDREIVNVPVDSIESVSVQTGDALYTLKQPRAGEYVLDGLASNETVESSAAGRLARALSPLMLMDVADPAQDASEQGFGEATRVEFATKFGERYTVEIGGLRTQGGGRYVRLNADYQKPPTPEQFEGVEPGSDEHKKKVEEFEKTCAEREKKVAELNELWPKWVYVVPDYQIANLTVPRSELVKVQQPEEQHPHTEGEIAPELGETLEEPSEEMSESEVPAPQNGAAEEAEEVPVAPERDPIPPAPPAPEP